MRGESRASARLEAELIISLKRKAIWFAAIGWRLNGSSRVWIS